MPSRSGGNDRSFSPQLWIHVPARKEASSDDIARDTAVDSRPNRFASEGHRTTSAIRILCAFCWACVSTWIPDVLPNIRLDVDTKQASSSSRCVGREPRLGAIRSRFNELRTAANTIVMQMTLKSNEMYCIVLCSYLRCSFDPFLPCSALSTTRTEMTRLIHCRCSNGSVEYREAASTSRSSCTCRVASGMI